jgi:hypothetical protein
MTERKRISFLDIPKRLTGISTPIFGVSWTPPEDKRKTVRRLVAFLEDRRTLYADHHAEYGPWVEQSILEMRKELTDLLKHCSDDDELEGPIRAMRAACRKFLDRMGPLESARRIYYPREALMWEALGELRATFGLHLARLCAAYGVDVEPDLAAILPAADESSRGNE